MTRVVFDLAGPAEPAAKSASAGLAFAFGSLARSGGLTASAPAAAPAPPVKAEAPAAPAPRKVTAAPEKVAVGEAPPAADVLREARSRGRTEPVVKAADARARSGAVCARRCRPPRLPPSRRLRRLRMRRGSCTATPEIRAIPESKPAPVVNTVSHPVAPAPEAAAPKRKKRPAEDKALIEAAETLLVQQDAARKPREIANPYETRTLGAGDKQYTGEPITLNLKDADIKDTLQRFSELTAAQHRPRSRRPRNGHGEPRRRSPGTRRSS